jgi:UDP-N-acetylmuramyl pentapeptide phosphotransferase/UDP-N-acetylglucosamine-1-phosphate transferase
MNSLFTLTQILALLVLFFAALQICKLLIRLVIKMVHKYGILDQPDHRKLHASPTPSMGGVAVVLTMLFFLSVSFFYFVDLEWFFVSVCLLSFSILGFFDDWKNLDAKFKLFFQITFSVLAYTLGFKLESAFGLFGFYELPELVSFTLTIGIFILLINAYNLIDGIDELAGGIIAINFGVFVALFFILNNFNYLIFSVVGIGAIFGFLKFNSHPAKIFMGDSGSLPLGMIMSLLSFKSLNLLSNLETPQNGLEWMIPVIVAMNFIPFFDTMRVFVLRILKGYSPFRADRNHLHHLFLKNDLGHTKSSFYIHTAHSFIIFVLVLISPFLPLYVSLYVIIFLAIVVFEFNTVTRMKGKNKVRSRLIEKGNTFVRSNNLLKSLKR